ncbi:TetR/AcrR family transcriptional regulator [Nocardia sp. NPDC055029]
MTRTWDPQVRRYTRAARRSQLVEQAGAIFVANGYRATSMSDLARGSNIAKPTLYTEFSGKLELYLTVLQGAMDVLAATVDTALHSAEGRRERIEALVTALFELTDADSRAILVIRPDDTGEPSVELRIRRMLSTCAATIGRALGPESSSAAAQMLAMTLLTLVPRCAQDWVNAGRPISREEAIDTINMLCWNGIGDALRACTDTAGVTSIRPSQRQSAPAFRR